MKRIMILLVVLATAVAFTAATVTVGMATGSDTKPAAADKKAADTKPPAGDKKAADTKPPAGDKKKDKPKPPPPPEEGC